MKVFKYGLTKDNFTYGWHEKSLYRIAHSTKNYPLKKLNTIQIGNKFGYKIGGKRLTINQAKSMTTLFTKPIIIHDIKNMPF